jgi:hypothetical protein
VKSVSDPFALSLMPGHTQMQVNRKRLDRYRTAFGDYVQKKPPRTFSMHPKTRAARG